MQLLADEETRAIDAAERAPLVLIQPDSGDSRDDEVSAVTPAPALKPVIRDDDTAPSSEPRLDRVLDRLDRLAAALEDLVAKLGQGEQVQTSAAAAPVADEVNGPPLLESDDW
jgi:hypothetical protein